MVVKAVAIEKDMMPLVILLQELSGCLQRFSIDDRALKDTGVICRKLDVSCGGHIAPQPEVDGGKCR